MFLSKVEIVGFKSFAHKTSVVFDEGVTAIVGPNGCGKTNIVDAIRWVLGEQKTSVLRGEKMDSVIFNGAGSRKPLGFAEVALVVENTKHILPVEYSEVMISRRLFRSGESEYLLNKEVCRLKDISNLLMDSGMGPEAYSVIELSMVELLLNDREDYRKRLFEEASGITKYKARRQESLRKLDATRQDLVRVKDIMVEVERTVKGLKSQVNRAIRYGKFREELKKLERIYFAVKKSSLLEELQPHKSEIDELSNKYNELSGKVSKQEAIVEQFQPELLAKQNALTSAQEELNKFNENVRSVDNKLAQYSERLHSLKESNERIDSEIALSKTRIDENKSLMKKLSVELTAGSKELALKETDLGNMKTRRDKFITEYDKKKSIYLGKSQQIFDVMNQLSEKERDRDAIVREAEGKSERFKKLEATKRENEKRLDSAEKEKLVLEQDVANFSSALNEIKEKKAVLTRKSEEEKEKLLSLEKNLLATQAKLESLETRSAFLKNLVEENEGLPGGVAEVLNNAADLPGVNGTVADILSVPSKMGPAVDAALGEQAKFLVVDKWSDIKVAVKHLQATKKGRATFVALDRVPANISKVEAKSAPKGVTAEGALIDEISFDSKYNQLVNALLGDVLLVDGSVEIENEQSNTVSLRLVNSAGDINAVGYFYTGGSVSEDIVSIVGRKEKIEEFEKEIEKAGSDILAIEKSIKDQNTLVAELLDELNSLEENLSVQSGILEEKKRKREVLYYELQQLAKSLSTVEDEMKQIRESHKSNEGLDTLNYDISVLEKVRKKLQAEREKFQTEEEILEKERRDIEEKFVDVNAKFSRLNEFMVSSERDKERLAQLISTNEQELLNKSSELKHVVSSLKEVEKVKTDLEEQIDRLMEERRGYEEKVLAMREELNELQQEKQKDLDSFLELQHHVSDIREKMQTKKEYLVSVEQEIKFLEETAKEKGLTLDDEFDESEYDYDQVSTDIERLRQRLESFGPVNMEAVEEYEKEKERFTFLESQAKDLEDAEETLLETINKINVTAREKLVSTFADVQENFKQIFCTFFPKGDASMILEEGKDPLEAKVEIFAQPFGKNVQSIALFSGGEKTLTAIAILFAIYKVKPSPFCILDEVDAPLDDANIARFIKMIQQFSVETQFILVTHNKKTMEAAKNLYGVTMEETGISKLVSVQLNKNGSVVEEEVLQENV